MVSGVQQLVQNAVVVEEDDGQKGGYDDADGEART